MHFRHILFNEFDTGDENTGFRLPSFGDGQNPLTSFDIYMVFNDKVFDEQTGLLAFDLFKTDGIVGDKFLVNGKIQPVLHVSPRRYRFRWLNTGPSRFYQLFVPGSNNTTKSFWQISTDGNLLEKPVQVTSARFAVAERVDVIVDFTGQAGKTFSAYATGKGPFTVAYDVDKLWVPNSGNNSISSTAAN